uniref:Glucuronosyltransferase n=1 Tax=Megaselia scalaris TaxID=36166 RepID=T1GWK7_MEGSC
MPITSPSHHLWNKALMHELANKGHNLTILSADIELKEKLPRNVHYIHLEKSYDSLKQGLDIDAIIGAMGLNAVPQLYNWGLLSAVGTVESDGWKTLMNYPNDFKFDLFVSMTETKAMKLVVVFLSFLRLINGANILGLLGLTTYSHFIWNSAIFNDLASKGHNVTLLTVDLPKHSSENRNITYIHLEKAYEILLKAEIKNDIIGVKGLKAIGPIYQWSINSIEGMIESNGWKTLMMYPEDFKFDLIIFDYTIGNGLLGFVHKFKYPPLIGTSPFLNNPAVIDLIGNPVYPGFVPHWSTSYNVDMNFVERIHNFIIYIWDTL